MFDFLKNMFQRTISREEIAELLKTNTNMLQQFEDTYKRCALDEVSDNLYEVSAQQAKEMRSNQYDNSFPKDLVERIVEELVSSTAVWKYDGNAITQPQILPYDKAMVTAQEISKLPTEQRPQLTGTLMSIDCGGPPSYIALLDMYQHCLKATNNETRKGYYHRFRQGLDILDLDTVTYHILGMNQNSIGNWLPKIVEAVDKEGFFHIPATTIIKVPMPLLQLTRKDYMSLTNTTLQIVDRYCQRVFDLDITKDYFIKTGTYSSKFDFRNAHVIGEKEVQELGEYLLYIHFQANSMAHYDLSGKNQPCIYGVSTTNEWCVREFIHDKDHNPTIYNGLPLHTEYRVFVDFDTDDILGIHPYWDANVMKKRFGQSDDADQPKMKHDYVTYLMCEEKLQQTYEQNKNTVIEHLQQVIPNIDLQGQWSLDVMQNGDDFWIIDMALAEQSAYYDCVPKELRRPSPENWLPQLGE